MILIESIQWTLKLQSMNDLINERLRQRESEFSIKAPTTANLQHWNEGKGGNGNLRVDFFGVSLDFVQDCKLNLREAFIWRSGRHMNPLCKFNLGCVSTRVSFVTLKKLIPREINSCSVTFCVH